MQPLRGGKGNDLVLYLIIQKCLNFKEFIDGMDVVDVSTSGNKFTCFNMDGIALSFLDRFLLFEDLIALWNIEV